MSVWLREAGVARDTIGFASWLGLVYAFAGSGRRCSTSGACSFVGRLGRRRSWLVFSQVLIALDCSAWPCAIRRATCPG